jgi:hypothetical protein
MRSLPDFIHHFIHEHAFEPCYGGLLSRQYSMRMDSFSESE